MYIIIVRIVPKIIMEVRMLLRTSILIHNREMRMHSLNLYGNANRMWCLRYLPSLMDGARARHPNQGTMELMCLHPNCRLRWAYMWLARSRAKLPLGKGTIIVLLSKPLSSVKLIMLLIELLESMFKGSCWSFCMSAIVNGSYQFVS